MNRPTARTVDEFDDLDQPDRLVLYRDPPEGHETEPEPI